MSSLWTPSGEHKVPHRGDDTDPDDAPGGPPPTGGDAEAYERDYPSPEEEAAIKEQLAELSQRLAAAPPEEVVANHAYGMFELAAIHLSRKPANLPAARLAIDALAALVDTLQERLGPHTHSLREALSQIRLAYVQIATANSSDTAGDPAAAEPGTAEPGGVPEHAPEPPESDADQEKPGTT